MRSGYERRSAVAAVGAHLPRFQVGSRIVLELTEVPHQRVVELARPRSGAALGFVLATFGTEALPRIGASACANGTFLLGAGPGLWLLIASAGGASQFPDANVEEAFDIAVDTTDAWTQFAIVGSAARDLLAKGCALDLHPRVFREGCCAVTRFAQLRCVLHHSGVGYRLLVGRSYAVSLAEWLIEAGAEFGLELGVKSPMTAVSNHMHPYTHSS
jgi:sarcosine oxidase subunit gamma